MQESLGEALARSTDRIPAGLECFLLKHEPQGPVLARREHTPAAPAQTPTQEVVHAAPAQPGKDGLSAGRMPHALVQSLVLNVPGTDIPVTAGEDTGRPRRGVPSSGCSGAGSKPQSTHSAVG